MPQAAGCHGDLTHPRCRIEGSAGFLRFVTTGAYLFLCDGRLFVRTGDDGPIRPGTETDRSRAVLALQGNHASLVALLPPGHPDAFLVPPFAS